jgi:hypothetical protein
LAAAVLLFLPSEARAVNSPLTIRLVEVPMMVIKPPEMAA